MRGDVDKIACPPFLHCSSTLVAFLLMSTEPALRRALRYRIEDISTGWLLAPTERQRHPLRTGKHSCTQIGRIRVLFEPVELDLPALPLKPATACNSGANARSRNCSSRLAARQPRPQGKVRRFLAR